MHGKGHIRVAVGTFDSTCQIAFIDSGPGIPTEIRENGQIAVDCPLAGGTSVIVRLPI
jgi:hypothetical protein